MTIQLVPEVPAELVAELMRQRDEDPSAFREHVADLLLNVAAQAGVMACVTVIQTADDGFFTGTAMRSTGTMCFHQIVELTADNLLRWVDRAEGDGRCCRCGGQHDGDRS